jgi:hypothetical protein
LPGDQIRRAIIGQNLPEPRPISSPAIAPLPPTLKAVGFIIEERIMRNCAERQEIIARNLWSQRREGSLNWLALGLLLAAWNAADDGAATLKARRPDALRGYSHVSVRAAQRATLFARVIKS